MNPLWFLLIPLSSASISFDPLPAPQMETIVTVEDAQGKPNAGDTVRVVHRPGLHGEYEEAIGITDGRGRVRWTPSQAGKAIVRTSDHTVTLIVSHTHMPPSTIVLLALLGFAALCSIAYGTTGPWLRKRGS